MKKKTDFRWLFRIVLISVAASMVFTIASTEILGRAGYLVSFAALVFFIAVGIVFDVVGVAVTAAQEAPFHSMAAHRERGATEALRLIKNADKTASICNDVVGDVTGIVSGATAALIAARLIENLGAGNIPFQLLISMTVTGFVIGGKAAGKSLALSKSTEIVLGAGKLIHILRFKPNSNK